MAWYNPWGEIDELKTKLVAAEITYVRLTKQIKELESVKEKLEFTNKNMCAEAAVTK